MEKINIAEIVPRTQAEGPGVRIAIWVQGCKMKCPGCCNPELQPMESATSGYTVDELVTKLLSMKEGVEGITIIGGEPFLQAPALAKVAKAMHENDLGVIIYSGYTREFLEKNSDCLALIQECDILIDGPFRVEQKSKTRRWIGSDNQEIHFITNRYQEYEKSRPSKSIIEIRMNKNGVIINGEPI
jgi:anaerobic ribonucleoside-triphosphate reductase activating protein